MLSVFEAKTQCFRKQISVGFLNFIRKNIKRIELNKNWALLKISGARNITISHCLSKSLWQYYLFSNMTIKLNKLNIDFFRIDKNWALLKMSSAGNLAISHCLSKSPWQFYMFSSITMNLDGFPAALF